MAQLEDHAPTTPAPEGVAAEIEAHSIDIIPDSERRGNVRSQFTLWFATNANVRSFFSPKGVYGGWRWVAIVPYVLALGAQVPFLDQTLYVGPAVKALGGADISWIVGFVVAGGGYLVATRLVGGGMLSARTADVVSS